MVRYNPPLGAQGRTARPAIGRGPFVIVIACFDITGVDCQAGRAGNRVERAARRLPAPDAVLVGEAVGEEFGGAAVVACRTAAAAEAGRLQPPAVVACPCAAGTQHITRIVGRVVAGATGIGAARRVWLCSVVGGAVIDSGVARGGHLIGKAVGKAQGDLPARPELDVHQHGLRPGCHAPPYRPTAGSTGHTAVPDVVVAVGPGIPAGALARADAQSGTGIVVNLCRACVVQRHGDGQRPGNPRTDVRRAVASQGIGIDQRPTSKRWFTQRQAVEESQISIAVHNDVKLAIAEGDSLSVYRLGIARHNQ